MPAVPIFATLEPLEKVSQYTALGIRFWDLARDVAVTHGLEVTARPTGQPQLERRAFQTLSGIYAFRGLPGLRAIEASDPELPPGDHPLPGSVTAPFVVTVHDRLGRFLPVTFEVNLPFRGVYPGEPLPGFYLFSAPSRPVLSDLAVVRAQLLERLPAGSFRPASYALLEVEVPGTPARLGFADEEGSVVIQFPYPPFATTVHAAPPPGAPFEDRLQAWDARVRVRYPLPADNKPDRSSKLPGLGAILARQPPADIWETAAGPGQAHRDTRLVFGQPLLLQTNGQSVLWIEQ